MGSCWVSVPSFLWYSSVLTGYWVRTTKGKKFWIDRLIINLAEELGFNWAARDKTYLTHKRRNQQGLCMWPAGLNTPIDKVRGTSQVLGASVAMPSLPLDRAGLPGRSSRESGIWGLGAGFQVWVEYGYVLSPGVCCVRTKKFPSSLLGSFGWSEKHIDMSLINRRKSNKNSVPCEHGRDSGTLSNSPKWPKSTIKYDLKYYLQLKTKRILRVGRVSYGRDKEKQSKPGWLWCSFRSPQWLAVLRLRHPPLPGTGRYTSLRNGDCLYKCTLLPK